MSVIGAVVRVGMRMYVVVIANYVQKFLLRTADSVRVVENQYQNF